MGKSSQYPGLHHADQLIAEGNDNQRQVMIEGKPRWVACRPEGYPSLRNRFRLAWKVFTGKADAFVWEQQ